MEKVGRQLALEGEGSTSTAKSFSPPGEIARLFSLLFLCLTPASFFYVSLSFQEKKMAIYNTPPALAEVQSTSNNKQY